MNKLLVACALCCGMAHAAERVEVCAKQGQGQAYKVQALHIDGSELNSKTGGFSYTSFAKYIVIFWAEGQASVIEMDFSHLSVLGVGGKDQQGRKWDISTSSLCF